MVLLHSPTADGEGINAVRARDQRLEFAEIRPLQHGQPITSGEVVRLHPRADTPRVCDVEVTYKHGDDDGDAESRGGPTRVSNARYRRNWESIFGSRRRNPSELN